MARVEMQQALHALLEVLGQHASRIHGLTRKSSQHVHIVGYRANYICPPRLKQVRFSC